MSISAPPGHPSIGETLSSSFRDAYAVAKTNLVPAVTFIVIGSIAALLIVLSAVQLVSATTGKGGGEPAMPPTFYAGITVLDILVLMVSYFAFAAAVRTIHSEYRMTAGQFFGIIGYTLLAVLLTMLAALFFIIPGYWVGVKLTLTPYTYALTNGAPGALKTTWNMTTGYYWQTVGMLLAAGFCIGVLMDIVFFACAGAASQLPWSLVVFAPLSLALLVWALHVQALVYVRWANGLLPRANMPDRQAVPAPA